MAGSRVGLRGTLPSRLPVNAADPHDGQVLRHERLRTLRRYARPSVDSVARLTAQNDPNGAARLRAGEPVTSGMRRGDWWGRIDGWVPATY